MGHPVRINGLYSSQGESVYLTSGMKGKVSVNKGGTPKRKVGRPRKRIDTEAKSRRTAQNRAAQRAFRDRKEAKLKSLQERTELLEQRDAQNKITTDFLQGSLRSLLSEISRYRAKNSDDERILAFLDNLQKEQRDEEQQKRKYEEKETITAVSYTHLDVYKRQVSIQYG